MKTAVPEGRIATWTQERMQGWHSLSGNSWQVMSNFCIFLHFFQSNVDKAGSLVYKEKGLEIGKQF